MKKNIKETEGWTVLSAAEVIVKMAEDSKMECKNRTFKSALEYASKTLELTPMQTVLLLVLVNNESEMSWDTLASFFGVSRIKMRSYTSDLETLAEKRWIKKIYSNRGNCFKADPKVIEAMAHNKVFVPREISGKNLQQLVDEIMRIIRRFPYNDGIDNNKMMELSELIEANPELELCKTVLDIPEDYNQMIFLKTLQDYIRNSDMPDEVGVCTDLTSFYIDYPEDVDEETLSMDLEDGTNILFDMGLVEHCCDDGMADNEHIMPTQKAISLLEGYKKRESRKNKWAKGNNDVKSWRKIREKKLFYNDSDAEQLAQFTRLLSKEQLPNVQARLAEKGFRKGVACLFHGLPGTGKTASVYEIARQTGRDVMMVDISQVRDKYVGESEKALKRIFFRYRKLCQNSAVTPILLINEADAIISNRTENIEQSVDKMENAMQNILLQEMEDLDGILICTTNLTSNMDEAFDRRFLFKIELHKPEPHVKAKIWRSMIPEISETEAMKLASSYDFSGGQIENIARKEMIEYIISGKHPDFGQIESFCQAEYLNRKQRKSIMGFAA